MFSEIFETNQSLDFSFSNIPVTAYDWHAYAETADILHSITNGIILAWSIGAFAVLPYLHLSGIKGAVLVSCADRFSQKDENKDGRNLYTPRVYLKSMRRTLVKNKEKVLNNFFSQAVHPEWADSLPSFYPCGSTEQLSHGLDFLENFSFTSAVKFDKPVMCLSGSIDSILHIEAAELFANTYHCGFSRVENAGHILPLTRAHEIRRALALIISQCNAQQDNNAMPLNVK